MAAYDRRTFLTRTLTTGLAGFGASLLGPVGFLRLARAEPLAADEPILVVLQMSGGNDGISTCVPYGDDVYHRVRRQTRIANNEVITLDGYLGLHPRLKALEAVYKRGHMAIVQGCSYPSPNRSHFESMDIWHAASPDGRRRGSGWLGRAIDLLHKDAKDPDLLAALGSEVPFAMAADLHKAVAFTRPEQYRWRGPKALEASFEALNCECEPGQPQTPASGAAAPATPGTAAQPAAPQPAGSNLEYLHRVAADARASSERMRKAAEGYSPKAEYPRNRLAEAMALTVGLIAGRLPTRVYYVSFGSFDTHTQQRGRHDNLMGQMGDTVAAFLADLEAHGLADRVSVLAFSEFGRRLQENASGGTDHGVAGPMFVFGKRVQGGLVGKHPSLTDLDKGDLKMTTDFRSVYATVVEDWLGAPADQVLGASYPKLPLFGPKRT